MPVNLEYRNLREVERTAIIALMNDPSVRRHMPLVPDTFGETHCESFLAAKESMWVEYGYGPQAIFLDGKMVGWGGLQPAGADVELALVLHPDHWGLGRSLYHRMLEQAFGEMRLDTVTVLLPRSRPRSRWLLRMGFLEEGIVSIHNHSFVRYRICSQPPGVGSRKAQP